MKIFRNILLALLFLFFLTLIMGIVFIKRNAFQLVEWDSLTTHAPVTNGERPNILLLVAEDMSALVGAFGDKVAHTPNIDKLAKIGVRYPNTFTTAGVCSPSRAALITGVHQIAMGGQHMRTATRPEGAYQCVPPPAIKAFPELLRQAGYFTFNTAKQDYQFSGTMPGSGPFTIWDEENNSNLWRNRAKGQPFFGMMNFMETHESGVFTPLGHRPNSTTHFLLQVFRKIGGIQDKVVTIDPTKINLPPYYPNSPIIRKDIARHYENVAVMDVLVGAVFNKLEQDGLLENTIIIWTTDHGDGLPRAKRELYDSGIKVPMVIYYPEAFRPKGVEVGTIDEQLISFVDFAPTFLSLAKAPIPTYLHGQNFMASDTVNRQYVYASRDRIDEIKDRQRAVRNHRFKYIKSWYPEQVGGHPLAFRDNMELMKELWRLKAASQLNGEQLLWFQAPGKERLFDIQKDPFELQDLSSDTTYQQGLVDLRKAMDEWLNRVEDWSEESEKEMVNRFQPNGIREKTPVPEINQVNDLFEITAMEGASIGYQIEDSRWQLYHQPIVIPKGKTIKVKAVRYGWKESDMVISKWEE